MFRDEDVIDRLTFVGVHDEERRLAKGIAGLRMCRLQAAASESIRVELPTARTRVTGIDTLQQKDDGSPAVTRRRLRMISGLSPSPCQLNSFVYYHISVVNF